MTLILPSCSESLTTSIGPKSVSTIFSIGCLSAGINGGSSLTGGVGGGVPVPCPPLP